MRLVIMDWERAEIITLMLNDLNDSDVDEALIEFIEDKRPILDQPLWKSHTTKPIERPEP